MMWRLRGSWMVRKRSARRRVYWKIVMEQGLTWGIRKNARRFRKDMHISSIQAIPHTFLYHIPCWPNPHPRSSP